MPDEHGGKQSKKAECDDTMTYTVCPYIRTPEDLGVAWLGDPLSAVAAVARENRVSRAEYGRRLAKAEGGVFTPIG